MFHWWLEENSLVYSAKHDRPRTVEQLKMIVHLENIENVKILLIWSGKVATLNKTEQKRSSLVLIAEQMKWMC